VGRSNREEGGAGGKRMLKQSEGQRRWDLEGDCGYDPPLSSQPLCSLFLGALAIELETMNGRRQTPAAEAGWP
jgi:hypothetical protein